MKRAETIFRPLPNIQPGLLVIIVDYGQVSGPNGVAECVSALVFG